LHAVTNMTLGNSVCADAAISVTCFIILIVFLLIGFNIWMFETTFSEITVSLSDYLYSKETILRFTKTTIYITQKNARWLHPLLKFCRCTKVMYKPESFLSLLLPFSASSATFIYVTWHHMARIVRLWAHV